MALAYPLINGVRHSNAQIEIKLGASIFLGITELNYSFKANPGTVKATGPNPYAFTTGNYEYTADITFLLEEFNLFTKTLGQGFTSKTFPIVVSYDSPDNALSTIVDTLQGVRIASVENGGASGGSTDAITRKCELAVLGILFNGLRPGQAQATL